MSDAPPAKKQKTMSSFDIVPLRCQVQQYAWGKTGSSSKVAVLQSGASTPAGKIEDAPYAELWMGTHHKGPSEVEEAGSFTPLVDFLNGELPYLFKVLSVATALSIQAHPDKKLAEQLHADRPDVYKDPNHKPEMAVATTDFEAMCGFREPSQIAEFLSTVPELRAIVGETLAADFEKAVDADIKPVLKQVFSAVMNVTPEILTGEVERLVSRLAKKHAGAEDDSKAPYGDLDVEKLILRLSSQYPGDVGLFAPFLLNCFKCREGEAIFLSANLPHAYLSGDIIECMAQSDNVVRAGLTPKLRDTPTLIEMLTYETGKPAVFLGEELDQNTRLFSPPIDEFQLHRTKVAAGSTYTLPSVTSISLVLVFEGQGNVIATSKLSVQQGRVLCVNAGIDLQIEAVADLTLYRCFSK